jgi:hypothetical protein
MAIVALRVVVCPGCALAALSLRATFLHASRIPDP